MLTGAERTSPESRTRRPTKWMSVPGAPWARPVARSPATPATTNSRHAERRMDGLVMVEILAWQSLSGFNETSSLVVLRICMGEPATGTSRAAHDGSHPTLDPGAPMFAVIGRYNSHDHSAEKIEQRV